MFDKNNFRHLPPNIYYDSKLDLDQKICKYTCLFNLLMILTGKLYVSTKECFSDKYESGLYYIPCIYDFTVEGDSRPNKLHEKGMSLRQSMTNSKHWLTTCWTKKTEEDFALWKIFAPDPTSVRIKTTIKDLLGTLNAGMFTLYISAIHYTKKSNLIIHDICDYAFSKYSFYNYEDEVRFYFLSNFQEEEKRPQYFDLRNNNFISEITLSPFFPRNSQIRLKEYLIKYHGINENIIKTSDINVY